MRRAQACGRGAQGQGRGKWGARRKACAGCARPAKGTNSVSLGEDLVLETLPQAVTGYPCIVESGESGTALVLDTVRYATQSIHVRYADNADTKGHCALRYRGTAPCI